jgi:hypothetical protein
VDGKGFALVLVAVAAFSLLRIISQWRGVARNRRKVDWDEHFIQQLRKAGVNTFEPQMVDFFFTMPSRASAEQLSFALRPDGFELDIREDAAAHTFSLHATREARLNIEEMQALTARLTEQAAQFGGKYDSWALVSKRAAKA